MILQRPRIGCAHAPDTGSCAQMILQRPRLTCEVVASGGGVEYVKKEGR